MQTKIRLLSKEGGFCLAPPVGLEPTTCGLTEHESKSQRAKQDIKKRDWCFVFGDQLPTGFSKPIFAREIPLHRDANRENTAIQLPKQETTEPLFVPKIPKFPPIFLNG